MNIRAVILCCYLLITLPSFARDSTDVIVMKNGDHFTCKIKALAGATLYVSFPYAIETLSIDWSEVARLESTQLFLVKTESGAVYRGALTTSETSADRPVDIEIAETPESKVVLNSQRIVEVSATSDKFIERFTGGIGFSTLYTKANQSAQYSLNGLAAYPRERWAAQAGILSNLSTATNTPTSTRNQLTFEGMHLLRRNNYFVGGFDGFLQSSEEGIAGQNTLGGGVGRYLKNTNHTTITVLLGTAWQHTNYNPTLFPIATQNAITGVVRGNVKLFRFDKTNLDIAALALPSFSDPGRIYFTTNASYYIKLGWNLKWNVSFYGSWDTRPPNNLPGSDYGSSSGLTWTFGTSMRTKPETMP